MAPCGVPLRDNSWAERHGSRERAILVQSLEHYEELRGKSEYFARGEVFVNPL